MAVPSIDLLPNPALSTDPEDVFNTKTDATLLAQQKMVPQINTSLTWIGQQVAAVSDYRQQAAQSASNAADSASAASGSKGAAAQSAIDATNNGKAQVNLAKDQVKLAQDAAAAAQTAAQAAGAAAGLPAPRVPFTVLGINAAGNVAWGDGLIDKTNALPGQSLALGTGKVGKWDFVGQQVGDILFTSRDPGALYLPVNGGVRLQSAFPALFAKLGLIGGSIGTSWVDVNVGAGGPVGAATNGTVIVPSAASIPGKFLRSTDRGVNFTQISVPLSLDFGSIKSDEAGTWIAFYAQGTQQALRSTDDGLTWQVVALPAQSGGSSWYKGRYVGNRTWILLCTYNTAVARSTDNGLNWTTVASGYPVGQVNAIGSNGTGKVLISGYDGTNTILSFSLNYGASFAQQAVLTAQTNSIGCDNQGVWIIGLGGVNALRSVDDAQTFSSFTIPGGVGNTRDVAFIAGLVLFVFTGSGSKIIIQYPNGSFVGQSSAANVNGELAHAGNGYLFSNSATASRISRSLPAYGYDVATQFALPSIPNYIGANAYVKAKELA